MSLLLWLHRVASSAGRLVRPIHDIRVEFNNWIKTITKYELFSANKRVMDHSKGRLGGGRGEEGHGISEFSASDDVWKLMKPGAGRFTNPCPYLIWNRSVAFFF